MPTAKTARRRRKPPQRRYELDKYLTGELEGFHVVMGSTTAREAIRLRSGELSEGEAIEFVAAKVIEHDFDVADIRDLDLEDVLALSEAWTTAIKDRAVPPAQGNS
jgi:hypothetical protein